MVVDEIVDEFGKPGYKITTDKMKAYAIIYKSNDGFAHYRVKWSKGATPKELSGAYTGMGKALEAVTSHLNRKPMTRNQRTEKYYEENH